MALESSTVYKCLEKKTLILGFEVVDLFLMSVLLCVLNFVFVDSSMKLFFTFGPVAIVAALLRIMKMGKAENYLLHWIRFQIAPGVFKAWPRATSPNALLKIKQKGKYARRKSR